MGIRKGVEVETQGSGSKSKSGFMTVGEANNSRSETAVIQLDAVVGKPSVTGGGEIELLGWFVYL